ncbi:Membrane alanine aminopeptidase N [hydrothermal vent metagenome]|uniref:Membrane alanine aminopeptidase N n=1 Tax=hydrothermal vent metagenome TaxID=652676 RepID=A0A1W1CU07_9ZZZZ
MSKKVVEKFLKDYKKPAFKIESVELTFDLFEEETLVTNVMQITKVDANVSELRLDSINLELLDLRLNGMKLSENRYVIEEDSLTILNVSDSFELKIENRIYPQNNTELEGLYKSGDIFCTQNEPEGFRTITPYLDRPDVMSVFTTTVIADKERYPVLLSNGNRVASQDVSERRHSVTWHDPFAKPSYLFAVVAGNLGHIDDSFTTMSGREIALSIYCDLGNESKCFHAMRSLKEAMQWDEERYGREYDLEIYNIVAVDSFNMGAMENKGLNIFNSAYVLADMDTATDANFMGIESVIAHEYFHNWTGNRITCRDWFQLTLKEGLTVFRDQCFSADMNSSAVQRIEDVKALRERQFVEDSSPTRHPIQPKSYISMNNFYTATVYEKGAEVIRMIYTLIGKENYRKAMDLYFETFDAQAVTTDDFLWAMSSASGEDLEQFKRWYHQSGTPKLKVEEAFDAGVYSLRLTQIVPDAVNGDKQEPYYFPLKMGLLDASGKEIVQKTLKVSQESEEFLFEGLSERPILSINRDFSAPFIIEQEQTNYAFLMQHDTNSFVQYEATQNFALQTMNRMLAGEEMDEEFIVAYGALLELDIDLLYKAHLLELPSISALMQMQEKIDFASIYDVKEKLLQEIAKRYRTKLLAIYHENHKPLSDRLDAKDIAQRAIKNRVLQILSVSKEDAIAQLAKKQYEESVTMSDRVVAVDIIENMHAPFADEVLRDFYERYKDETLVMNKYFAIIASADREELLERVERMQLDKVYDEKVPNLVRSLIGSFSRNYKHFHKEDGSGYKFLADKIIAIDKINPQMASGLAGAFKIYDKLLDTNKSLVNRELERVVSTHNLSNNTYEIINKILKNSENKNENRV